MAALPAVIPYELLTLGPDKSQLVGNFLNNTVIERPQLTGMVVIQCYALLEWSIIRFKCINK